MKRLLSSTLLILITLLLAGSSISSPLPVQAAPLHGPMPALPAQVDGNQELPLGHWSGTLAPYATHYAHWIIPDPITGGEQDHILKIKWPFRSRVDNLDIVVTGKYTAVATLVWLYADPIGIDETSDLTGGGANCHYWSTVFASGTWMPKNSASYDTSASQFDFPLELQGIDEISSAAGDSGCKLSSASGIEAGKRVLELISPQITQITLYVNYINYTFNGTPWRLGGSCTFKGWDKKFDIPGQGHGAGERTSICAWQVFRLNEGPQKGWRKGK